MTNIESLKLTILLLVIFAPLAGIMSFVITYMEYSHHFPDKRSVFEKSKSMGIITFIVFSILTILFSLILDYYVNK